MNFGVRLGTAHAGIGLGLHAPDEAVPLHEHEGAYVCVVLAGGFTERSGGTTRQRRAGDAIVHPAGARHADRFSADGGRLLNVHLGASDLLQPGTQRATPRLRLVATELAAMAALDDDAGGLGLQAARAELCGLLAAPGARAGDIPVARVLEALDDAPRADWTLLQLAALAGRHPTHLARAFRDTVGISIGAWRRRRRLVDLCVDLRRSDLPLAELALAHGYADQAHMNREFRAFAGSAPGAWRRRYR